MAQETPVSYTNMTMATTRGLEKIMLPEAGILPPLSRPPTHGYFQYGSDLMKYDIDADLWKPVDFEPVPNRNDSFFFNIGETIFIGGGRENSFKDFWECDTSLLD